MRVVCSAKGEEGDTSNLIITSANNRYVLTLQVQDESPFDVVTFQLKSSSSETSLQQPIDPLAQSILSRFIDKEFNKSDSNGGIRFSISKIILLGDCCFTIFSVENNGIESIKIKSVDFSLITVGGLTGLPIKESKYGSSFLLQQFKLEPGQKTNGVLSVHRPELTNDQEIAVRLVVDGKAKMELNIARIKL